MSALWCFLLILALGSGWLLTVLGWPGNWLMVAASASYAWLVPDTERIAIGWPVVIASLVFAIIAEVAEFAASAFGVRRLGGSRRTATLSIIGSIVGSVVGLFIGVPVPLIGSLLGALIFAGLGAAGGAAFGEYLDGRHPRASLPVATAAFIGRLLGTAGKVVAATLILVIELIALVSS